MEKKRLEMLESAHLELGVPKTEVAGVVVRFANFELDLRTGELQDEGQKKVRLPEQPFQILTLLLEHPGDVVLREEIRQRLWPNDTIVEFEHSISAAMNKLRQALGDSANDPRYIETLPRRGYRWKVAAEHIGSTLNPAASVPSTARSHASMPILFAALLLMIGAGLFLLGRWGKRTQPAMNIVVGTTLPGFERNATFSPDGNQFAFVYFDVETQDQNIFVKAIGDEKMVQLTHTKSPDAADCPIWSPDGKTIAYSRTTATSPTTSENAIFLMTALGGSQHQLQSLSPDASCQMSWSPDSRMLAFGNTPVGESSGIFLVSPSGSPAIRLTTAPSRAHDGDPAFSPDGRQIAFVRWTSPDSGDLYQMTAQGSQVTKITALNRLVLSPAWTADGKRLIFGIYGFFGNSALYSVAASGGEPEPLPFISTPAFSPAISRQGDKLAFATLLFDGNIWSIPLRDPASPRLSASPGTMKWPSPKKVIASTRFEMQPQLSPDGSRLAYVSDQDGALAVWLSKPDGTDPFRLVSSPLGGSPDWSPDGNNIVFDSAQGDGYAQIYVVGINGGAPTAITSGPYKNGGATWSADGKWIYFASNRSGRFETWKAPFHGQGAVQVTTHGGGYAVESPDGKFVYFQKTVMGDCIVPMFPQIWRMPVAGGAEEPVVSVSNPTQECCAWFWRLTAEGIYFIDNTAQPLPAIKFYSFASRKTSILAQLEKKAFGGPGLSVSRDRRMALFSQIDNAGSDIMVVQNFR